MVLKIFPKAVGYGHLWCYFLCHVTIFCSQNILLMTYMFLVWHIISLVKYHFAMGNLVNMRKHPKTTSGGCFIYLYRIFRHFKFWSKERIMAAIFEPLFTKLKPTFYQSQYLSQWLSQSWDWDLLWNPLRLSPWAQVKYPIIWDKSLKFESETGLRPFVKSAPDHRKHSKK